MVKLRDKDVLRLYYDMKVKSATNGKLVTMSSFIQYNLSTVIVLDGCHVVYNEDKEHGGVRMATW